VADQLWFMTRIREEDLYRLSKSHIKTIKLNLNPVES